MQQDGNALSEEEQETWDELLKVWQPDHEYDADFFYAPCIPLSVILHALGLGDDDVS